MRALLVCLLICIFGASASAAVRIKDVTSLARLSAIFN